MFSMLVHNNVAIQIISYFTSQSISQSDTRRHLSALSMIEISNFHKMRQKNTYQSFLQFLQIICHGWDLAVVLDNYKPFGWPNFQRFWKKIDEKTLFGPRKN